MERLTSDEAIDIAYEIFLEMAGENLNPADIGLFNAQFEANGAIEVVETSEHWVDEIGVLIDPEAFIEVWIGLVNDKDEISEPLARVLISNDKDSAQYHIIWK